MKRIIHTLLVLAALIGTGFSAERNQLPAGLAKAFESANEATLYSIDPNVGRKAKAAFHGYPILGQMNLSGADLKSALTEVNDSVKNYNGVSMRCFNPRHGIRVKSGDTTYDLLLCFECGNFNAFKGDAKLPGGGMTGTGKVMNALLAAAKIPLAEPPSRKPIQKKTRRAAIPAGIAFPVSLSAASFSVRDGAPLPALMKRAAPKPVEAVVANGVEYTAPNEAMGFVVATDKAAGKELWRVQIYKITRDPQLEGDVQDVFITKLQLDGARLLITDEHNRRFSLDLKTREVAPISKR